MCGQVYCMCSSNYGDTVMCWDEMLWAGSSWSLFSRFFSGWENTLMGSVGGNLCFVAAEVIRLEKGKEKGGHGGWTRRRRGSFHLLPCWSTVMLMASCKAGINRGLPFMRASTSYRVSWHCPLISVATMGLCALFFVCSTMIYSWAMMQRRSCRTLFILFSVSAGSLHLCKAWRILKLCQTTRIKS